MKRVLAGVMLGLVCLTAAYGYWITRRERLYQDLVARGDAALARDDTSTAIEAYSGAIALKGDSMLGHLKRGETHRRRGELEAALRDVRRAAELDPTAPLPLEVLGDVNYALGRFDRAADRYQASISLDDRSPRVLYKFALSRYRLGHTDLAVETLNQAIAIDERFAEAHYLLGVCYRDLQKLEDSLRALRQSIVLAPTLLHAREALAGLYASRGQTHNRIAQLEALRALDSSPAREIALGLAYARASQAERAVLTLGSAAERHPDHRRIYTALGRVWLESAQVSGDSVALSKALGALQEAAPDDSEALTLLGRALLLVGDHEQAERVLQQASEKFPVDSLAFYFLAETAEGRGHHDIARRALLDYEALEGEGLDARRRAALATRIADLSLHLGDAPMAVTFYQRAVDAVLPDAALLSRLAQAQWSAGDPDAARATLARALEKDPTNSTVQALRRRIR